MHADLDLLCISVYCTADDLLPERPRNARRRLSDAEIVTLCVAQVLMGIPSDRRFLRAARRQLGHLFPQLPRQDALHKRRARLAEAIEWLVGVFAVQLCKAAGANAIGVVSSDEKGELIKQLGAVDYINRAEFGDMMRTKENLADPAADKERFKASRGFAKRVKEILGDAPDIVFEHVGQATFPTSVFVVKPFGKVVICGATSGFQLDFDVRYLWMRQKQIIGSHFANAYECMRANQLMAEGKVQPVLWKTMDFDGVPGAHQLLHENKHLGKISILVGAAEEGQGRTADGPGAIRAEVGA